MKNLTIAKAELTAKNLIVDCVVTSTSIAPTYGLGDEISARLRSLATRVEHVPTRRSTKRNPKTLPVYYFA